MSTNCPPTLTEDEIRKILSDNTPTDKTPTPLGDTETAATAVTAATGAQSVKGSSDSRIVPDKHPLDLALVDSDSIPFVRRGTSSSPGENVFGRSGVLTREIPGGVLFTNRDNPFSLGSTVRNARTSSSSGTTKEYRWMTTDQHSKLYAFTDSSGNVIGRTEIVPSSDYSIPAWSSSYLDATLAHSDDIESAFNIILRNKALSGEQLKEKFLSAIPEDQRIKYKDYILDDSKRSSGLGSDVHFYRSPDGKDVIVLKRPKLSKDEFFNKIITDVSARVELNEKQKVFLKEFISNLPAREVSDNSFHRGLTVANEESLAFSSESLLEIETVLREEVLKKLLGVYRDIKMTAPTKDFLEKVTYKGQKIIVVDDLDRSFLEATGIQKQQAHIMPNFEVDSSVNIQKVFGMSEKEFFDLSSRNINKVLNKCSRALKKKTKSVCYEYIKNSKLGHFVGVDTNDPQLFSKVYTEFSKRMAVILKSYKNAHENAKEYLLAGQGTVATSNYVGADSLEVGIDFNNGKNIFFSPKDGLFHVIDV